MYQCKEKFGYKDILKIYESACKSDKKIGIEYERIPVNNSTRQNVSYYGLFGICEILKEFAKIDNWDYILDNNEIIGLKKLHDTITLEPGAQIEISVEPQNTVKEIEEKINQIDSVLLPLFKNYDSSLINLGVSPNSTYRNIEIIPKRRYRCMANYLWGILSDVMMRETAGIQVGIDYSSEEDAAEKFYISNMISPFMTALFANSSQRGGVDSGYKSFRALSWLNTDNERCGLATTFRKKEGFKDYIDKLLDVPMIFIMRENNLIFLNGKINFRQFMDNDYLNYTAEIDDFYLHSNLFFPDIRLRKFIEIRNHDCVGNGLQYSIPAIYKGILYNKSACNDIETALSELTSNDIEDFRYYVPRLGLETKIGKYLAKDFAKEIVNIAYNTLYKNNDFDSEYILPVYENLK